MLWMHVFPVNNFDIKQNAWNICFVIYHQQQTKSKRMNGNKGTE